MPAPRLVAIGLAGGFAGGLLGIGGGAVMVPLMVAYLAVGQRMAHALSLGAIVPLAVAATVIYGAADEVRWGTAVALFAGGAVGAPLGAWLLARADDRLARRAFGLLMISIAIYLVATG